jgi:hypothetical protein
MLHRGTGGAQQARPLDLDRRLARPGLGGALDQRARAAAIGHELGQRLDRAGQREADAGVGRVASRIATATCAAPACAAQRTAQAVNGRHQGSASARDVGRQALQPARHALQRRQRSALRATIASVPTRSPVQAESGCQLAAEHVDQRQAGLDRWPRP